jgi:hypothetical protein
MKRYLLFPALSASSILILAVSLVLPGLTGFAWACPGGDPNDLGDCDTLIAFFWDEEECNSFPCLVHVSLLVTHDSNTIPGSDPPTQDSIAGLISGFIEWTHTNPSAYCSLSLEKNIPSYDDTVNGIFRHFGGKRNRLLDWYEMGKAWTTYYGMNNSYQYFWLSAVPMQSYCQRWWEGDRVLLATFTFTVSDTMTICLDTTMIMMQNLTFTRTDAVVYFPRHNMPLCMQVFIRGDANGNGEIHIEDIVYLINYLFMDGPSPPTVKSGDANCDEVVDVADVIYLMNYLFGDGPEPSCYY